LPIWWDGIDAAGPFTISSDADLPDIDGAFNISWTLSENAISYAVYRYDSYITEINGSLTMVSMDILDLFYYVSGTPDGTWYFAVTAEGPTGANTTSSNNLIITVTNYPHPFSAWTNASDPDTDGTFTIEWETSDYATEYSVYEYSDYITEINGSVTLIASDVSGFIVVIEDYVDGTYYFVVVANNSYGSMLSNNVIVVVGHTPDFFILTTDADEPDTDGEFLLTWDASDGALYYNIYEDGDLIAEDVTETEYLITNRADGTYEYTVVAVNQYGETESNTIVVTVEWPGSIFEIIIAFILEIIAFILGLFGLGVYIKRRQKRAACPCIGTKDCKCDI
jgi:hypothetical protein